MGQRAQAQGPGLSAEPPRLLQSDKTWLWANKSSYTGRAVWQNTSTHPSRGAAGPVYGGRPRELRMKWIAKQRLKGLVFLVGIFFSLAKFLKIGGRQELEQDCSLSLAA